MPNQQELENGLFSTPPQSPRNKQTQCMEFITILRNKLNVWKSQNPTASDEEIQTERENIENGLRADGIKEFENSVTPPSPG